MLWICKTVIRVKPFFLHNGTTNLNNQRSVDVFKKLMLISNKKKEFRYPRK